MKRFLFRTDANHLIGTGHMMRCLALANALERAGAQCLFLCRGAGLGVLREKIQMAGHQLLLLPEVVDANSASNEGDEPAPWLMRGGWEADAEACHKVLQGQEAFEWLVVDHYSLDYRWQHSMRKHAGKIFVIDDLANRVHDCDIVLDQSFLKFPHRRYDGLVPESSIRLLGPRFALLREEFKRERVSGEQQNGPARDRLFVMFGGADPSNLTRRVLEVLQRIGWRGVVDVVVGPLYQGLAELRQLVADAPWIHLHIASGEIATLMRSAMLGIGSPGVSSWERCACSLPSLAIAQADNQELIGNALGVSGAHLYLGRHEKITDEDISNALMTFLRNEPARQAMQAAAEKICDGNGIERVISYLHPPFLKIRRAALADAKLLHSWRNDEAVRQSAHDSRPIDYSEHLEWMKRILDRQSSDLLLAMRGDTPVACIRFDCEDTKARVSIYTDPLLQGKKLGRASLVAAMEWLATERPHVEIIEADVMDRNDASKAMFLSAGFDLTWSRYERAQEKAMFNKILDSEAR
jgi:UDP-2,4-diacetamido-2,4,6-trideoxy-beta-L-altropyranose hydrolase